MLTQKSRLTIIVILAVFLFISYTAYLFKNHSQSKQLPRLYQVQDFNLFDEEGEPFSLSKLQGDIWVANFFFTTCGDICPIMSKNMAALHRSFDLVGDVKQVSITVHPEYDSSDILKGYAEKFDANTDKWHFLTGPRAQIQELAVNSFKLGDIKEPVFHSAKFALVDRQGFVRGYYDGVQDGEVSQLFSDIAVLLRER